MATPTRLSAVLGPAEPGEAAHPLLVAALLRRLSELDVDFDAVALIAAGTSDAGARSTVEGVARELADELLRAARANVAERNEPDDC